MQSTPVVPDYHIRRILPLDADRVLFLGDVVQQAFDERIGFVLGKALDRMRMSRNINVPAITGFVDLNEAVTRHNPAVRGVQVLEKLWGAKFTRLGDRVVDNVVLLKELLLKFGIQLVPGGPRVSEVCITAIAWRWDVNSA